MFKLYKSMQELSRRHLFFTRFALTFLNIKNFSRNYNNSIFTSNVRYFKF